MACIVVITYISKLRQTGSGKTYSMGTGLESTVNPEHEGI
jgi:hypothetical protein